MKDVAKRHQVWGLSAPMMLVSLVRRTRIHPFGLNEVRIKAGAQS